ncbi:MAG: zinc-binding alcohol dehydrogenase [Steroidobacteraceae bacterium]|jgi:threonine dehydrogenase-like Zn-dependent dehydrogenase|nr:zinc-binding alcohol dehydrogenase [Steroidobacteraceae bacterium]
MSTASAFWITAPGRGEIRDEILRPAGPGEALVRALYSGISRGTESLVHAGRVPPSEYARMRAPFQDGEFPAPVKYGYASVGRVESGPAELVGRVVFCLYPHQTRYVVPVDALHPVPDAVPPARAVLAANLETAINGLWDATPRVGDRIAVVGGGTVGCLVAWLAARVPGCRVELVDVDPAREALARALGLAFASPAAATPDADLVLHASGAPAGLETALALAGDEASVVELSWYGDREVRLPLGGAFHARRLTIRSSQVGRLPPAQQPRWTHRRRLALALELLADPVLDALIAGECAFAELPAAVARLAAHGALCHRVRYD